MKPHPSTAMHATTNLILYGPPGTGKTYATAWEAVRLCLGGAGAESIRNDRSALMAEYHRLVGEGRIEFVTFHQSMAYEDFVEGRQPTTGSDDGEDESSAGFRLETVPGIFRRIAKRAETGSARKAITNRITTEDRQIYKMSVGFSRDAGDQELFEEVIEVVILSLIGKTLTGAIQNTKKPRRSLKPVKPRQDRGAGLPAIWTGLDHRYVSQSAQSRRYHHCFQGNRLIRAIGEVTGSYVYRPRPEDGSAIDEPSNGSGTIQRAFRLRRSTTATLRCGHSTG